MVSTQISRPQKLILFFLKYLKNIYIDLYIILYKIKNLESGKYYFVWKKYHNKEINEYYNIFKTHIDAYIESEEFGAQQYWKYKRFDRDTDECIEYYNKYQYEIEKYRSSNEYERIVQKARTREIENPIHYQCGCGSKVLYKSLKCHRKTKKHKKYLLQFHTV